MEEKQTVKFKAIGKNVLQVHLIAIFILVILVVFLFSRATQVDLGLPFLMFLFSALLLAVPIPLFVSRLIAFQRSSYTIEREGIRLQWGNRIEDIPISDVLWVRSAEDLTVSLTLPWPRWPGGIVGITKHVDAGTVEFMASNKNEMVLIGTENKVIAISPENGKLFISTYHRITEMGSISPMKAFSAYPTFLFGTIWKLPSAKIFFVISIILGLGLFLWVGVAVPNRDEIFLGFTSQGYPLGPIQANQLYLLPSLNIILQATAFFLSTHFHRINPKHPLTYILWMSSTVMSVLFYFAIYLSLQVK